MSHPDPLYDEENTMSDDAFDRFDEMAERTIWPWCDDESHDSDEINYNDHNDFFDSESEDNTDWEEVWGEHMDGDHDSAMDSIGWGDDDSLAYGCGEEDF